MLDSSIKGAMNVEIEVEVGKRLKRVEKASHCEIYYKPRFCVRLKIIEVRPMQTIVTMPQLD